MFFQISLPSYNRSSHANCEDLWWKPDEERDGLLILNTEYGIRLYLDDRRSNAKIYSIEKQEQAPQLGRGDWSKGKTKGERSIGYHITE